MNEPQPATSSGLSSPVTDTVRLDPLDTIAYLTGHFDPATNADFTEIRPEHAVKPGMWLRKDAYADFIRMFEAARQDGVELRILSAARNFDYQKQIWEKKWNGITRVDGDVDLSRSEPDPVQRALRILRYSAMPGTSRHHWGTDIDLNALDDPWFATREGRRVYEWLTTNASAFGYCQPYSPKNGERPSGYEEEKWHWSWMPLAQPLTRVAAMRLKDTDIHGFDGDSTAVRIEVVHNYILGINNLCR